MDKIKNVFSKIGSTLKSNIKIVAIVAAVIVVAAVVVIFFTGSEKRAIKKYLNALNTYDKDKIVKRMDIEAAAAFDGYFTEKSIEDFSDKIDDVDSEDKDHVKDAIKESAKARKKNKVKYKLIKVVNVATAKDDKNIKKVVVKVKRTATPSKDDDDDDKDDIWKGSKSYKVSETEYMTFYLYKGKVIG